MQIDLIVSRHPAAVEFLAAELGGHVMADHVSVVRRTARHPDTGDDVPVEFSHVPVLAVATADDVRGKHVAGNLPLHLAALCRSVTAIEFADQPPRGQEYGLAEMHASGARLVRYVVQTADDHAADVSALREGAGL